MYGERKKRYAPVKEGDIVDLKIEADGTKGDGIAKVEGFIVFVKDAKKGDELKVKITRVLDKYAFGEVLGEGSSSESESSESSEDHYEDNEEEEGFDDEAFEDEEEDTV
ncbi:MAG TPA: TRAM domain-containing protein [Candidatus Nanoarchaeia archaeon]|nr:TRAM domain-containing protein [Candidatus Nanoarchaeia archaeon]